MPTSERTRASARSPHRSIPGTSTNDDRSPAAVRRRELRAFVDGLGVLALVVRRRLARGAMDALACRIDGGAEARALAAEGPRRRRRRRRAQHGGRRRLVLLGGGLLCARRRQRVDLV